MSAAHVPVMLEEALEGLAVREDGVYVDATFGAGGHSRAILERLGRGRLIALDVDPSVCPLTGPQFELIHTNFRELDEALASANVTHIDGILFDFGVSSMQLDQVERGFSFQQDAPLDMRMNPTAGQSAYELLQTISEKALADILFTYGEERAARRIAKALIHLRQTSRLPKTTRELAAAISGVVHRPGFRERTHPATRSFQALRIAVNDELQAITEGLEAALTALRIGGRIVAISFHSLEDRIVKRCFRDNPKLQPITRKPLFPSEAEIHRNPRARSARLRIAERVEIA